ncbi:hypothetical protein J3E68DRAFT_388046 [Trichoderma sp. SZMC 28012]
MFLGRTRTRSPTYLSLEMTTESLAKKATMMSMKCNNVAFIPLFTILGCKARCCWLKAMPDPVHYENICRRLLLALTKCHSSVWSALPRRILPKCALSKEKPQSSAMRCITPASAQDGMMVYLLCVPRMLFFSFLLSGICRETTAPKSLSRLNRTTEKSVVQDAFTCCHGPEGFWPIVNVRPGRG